MESDSGECDGKSVTTDEGDEFDFTAIRGGSSAKDALDVQKMAHIFFELNQAAPKLEQLATVLKGTCMNCSDLVCAIGFVKQLRQLKMELTRMIDNVTFVVNIPIYSLFSFIIYSLYYLSDIFLTLII